jgi:hypothetical protein
MRNTRLLKRSVPVAVIGAAVGVLGISSISSGQPAEDDSMQANHDSISFRMTPSAGAARCLPKAIARVRVQSLGPVERMRVDVSGLPPHTDFDFFVIQIPNAPFGLAWYQGDIETDAHGRGTGEFIGRFNTETFIVAPGSTSAPDVHDLQPFVDAKSNPATGPVHTFHLGLWFNSPADAAHAGCPNTVTPFNGEHHAGIQVLNTDNGNFTNDQGPLRQLQP